MISGDQKPGLTGNPQVMPPCSSAKSGSGKMYAFEKDQRRATALLKRLKVLTGFQQSRGSKDGEGKKIRSKQKHLGGRWGG